MSSDIFSSNENIRNRAAGAAFDGCPPEILGILLTVPMGFLFTVTLGIPFSISTKAHRFLPP